MSCIMKVRRQRETIKWTWVHVKYQSQEVKYLVRLVVWYASVYTYLYLSHTIVN